MYHDFFVIPLLLWKVRDMCQKTTIFIFMRKSWLTHPVRRVFSSNFLHSNTQKTFENTREFTDTTCGNVQSGSQNVPHTQRQTHHRPDSAHSSAYSCELARSVVHTRIWITAASSSNSTSNINIQSCVRAAVEKLWLCARARSQCRLNATLHSNAQYAHVVISATAAVWYGAECVQCSVSELSARWSRISCVSHKTHSRVCGKNVLLSLPP